MHRPDSVSPEPHPVHPQHRSDIDGLRVFAIFAVVLFHGALIPGGYIGVDVFFVISGFLMASIIQQGLDGDRFTFSEFYARRARRIFPAFVAVLAAIGIAGCFLLLPGDVRALGRSLIAAAEFRTNFYFYENEKGYFTADVVQFEPLLHTWSLSVEMQFYLIFPVLLWVIGRYARRHALPVILALAAVSLWHSQHMVAGNPQYSFYMLPSRMWELLAGAVIFYLSPLKAWRMASFALALGLLFGPAFFYSERMSFPGLAALPPVLGACLILLARPGSGKDNPLLCAVLGNRVTAILANLSYSFYLWHWPLFVYARYNYGEILPWQTSVLLLGASLGLAALTYYWVERPFLMRKSSVKKTLCIQFAMLVFLALGGLTLRYAMPPVLQGFLPANVLTLYQGREDMLRKDCLLSNNEKENSTACRLGAPGGTPGFILWGDSFARMWIPGIDEQARARDLAGLQSVRSACSPSDSSNDRRQEECRKFNADTLEFILGNKELKTVVLAANWHSPDKLKNDIADIAGKLTADGRKIYLILNPPRPEYQVPRALAISELRGFPRPELQDDRAYKKHTDSILENLKQSRDEYGLNVIELRHDLCPEGKCLVEARGRALYSDGLHLTKFAVVEYRHVLDGLFNDIERRNP